MSDRVQNPKCETCGSRNRSVFCALNKEQLHELDSAKSCDVYRKGETIFREGSYPRGLYCVNNGKIKLSKSGSTGKEQILRFATGGDVMGYNSMLTNKPLVATATAIDDAAICFIPADQFFSLIKEDAKFSLNMLELTAKNWHTASRLLTDMAQKSSKQRLAEMLLWLKETFGLDEDDCIDIKLSREEIANMVGTATEAVIRLLSDLKKQGLILLEGKRIRLMDIHGLASLAELED